MKKTKKKITKAAIALFNEYGIPSVRLQQIADKCDISLGNLAYHFPIKQDLLVFVAEYISTDIDPILKDKAPSPYLIDFDNRLAVYYNLINQYSFYFLDIMELQERYAHIHSQRAEYIDIMIQNIYQWIRQKEEKGLIRPEVQEGQYQRLSQAIWMIIIFWTTQQKIRSSQEKNEEEFKLVVWNQILPNFTELGLLEYEALILPQLQQYQPEFDKLVDLL